jgi:hypothetical protein
VYGDDSWAFILAELAENWLIFFILFYLHVLALIGSWSLAE